jgi:ubiquinone/menaquinone biosynthesis C-methylase UbiE
MSNEFLPSKLRKQISFIRENYLHFFLKNENGKILEIGYGKGNNFKYINNKCQLFAIEKYNDESLPLKYPNVLFSKTKTELLPYQNGFFDVVFFSFVFCSVKNQQIFIDEIYRVLKPNGKLILIEHIKSNRLISIIFQNIIDFLHRILFNSCHMKRDPRPFLDKNFVILFEKKIENFYQPYLFIYSQKKCYSE